jgi:glycosyltransferase involved in cell wall biosynthesis
MNRPLVSVITNTYNGSRFLRANVECIKAQDYSAVEHIMVDCGSTDDSAAVLASIAHPGLRVIQAPFCGVSEGRNIGIKQARGEYVAILDVDDVAFPQRLRRQVDALEADPTLIAVGSQIVRHEEDTGRRKTFGYPTTHRELQMLLRVCMNSIPHSTLMLRRSAYEQVGGYRKRFEKSEDFDLLLRLARLGRLASVPAPLVEYAMRSDSHSEVHRPKGRNATWYGMLATILDAVGPTATEELADEIERWLDGVGLDGLDAMRGRWALHDLRHPFGLDYWTVRFLSTAVLVALRTFPSCARKPWWREAATPQDVARACASRIKAAA